MKLLKSWNDIVERKRFSMPSKIFKIKLRFAIAFLLLVFGIIAALSTVKMVLADNSDKAKTSRIMHVKIQSPLDSSNISELMNKFNEANYDKFYGVVVEFNDINITSEAAIKLLQYLMRNKSLAISAYVKNRVESNLLIPLLAFDEIIFDYAATLGPLIDENSEDLITDALSEFRGSKDSQTQQFVSLIEKWGDPAKTLYKKVENKLVLLSLEAKEGYDVWISANRQLVLRSTEASNIHLGTLLIEKELSGLLAERGYTITNTEIVPKNLTNQKKLPNLQKIDLPDVFSPQKAVMIDLTTDIDEVVADSIIRRINHALNTDATMLIILLDTPGGRIDSTLRITKKIEEASSKMITIAWVKREAISAGAMIAITCNYIAMNKNTTIGDCQPIIPTSTGYEVAGEKIQTYLRAHFRKFAKEHGIPEALGEAMVTQELEVVEIKPRSKRFEQIPYERFMILDSFEKWNEKGKFEIVRTVVRNNELLTLNDSEAREYGFALSEIQSFDDLKRIFNIQNITSLGTSGSEDVLRFLNSIAPVIIAIGLLGLLIEMKTPGFGLFGILGIAIIGGFFGIKLMVGLAEYWEILLFIVGIGLLVVEIFVVPGTGIFGLLGILFVLAGIFFAGQPFIIPENEFESTFLLRNISSLIFSVIGALIAFYIVAKFLHKIPFIKKLILTPDKSEDLHASAVELKRDDFVGAIGLATTDLRPVGKAKIGDDLLDVQVKGFDYVEKNQKIIVIETSGNRIIVKRFDTDKTVL